MNLQIMAVLSDIHGNYTALQKVLTEIRQLKEQHHLPIEKIICLGDTFGYGPNPIACFDIAKTFDINLYGNHENMTKSKMENPFLNLTSRASETAHESTEKFVNLLIGKQTVTSAITGFQLELPNEDLRKLLQKNYILDVSKSLIEQTNKTIKISSPEISRIRLQKNIPQEILNEIRSSYLTKILYEQPNQLENVLFRISRRNKAIEIYHFLENLENKLTFELNNAIFVHDNPLNPGDGKYLIDKKTAQQIGITTNKASISEITSKRFPGIEYIFVGHTHAKPKTVKIDKIKLVYVGSVGKPRGDNPEKNICYTLIQIENNKVIKVGPRILDPN